MFYNFEPIWKLGLIRARDGAMAREAVDTLKHLMHCNYTNIGNDRDVSSNKHLKTAQTVPSIIANYYSDSEQLLFWCLQA